MSQKYYAIEANAGAYTDIPCTKICRKMKISECRKSDGSAYSPQGLRYKLRDDPAGAFATVFYGVPGEEIPVGNEIASQGNGASPLVGMAMQNGGAAYAGGTTYALGNVVVSAGLAYVSIQAGNTGHTPASSPTWWTEVHNYRPADVVVKLLSDTASATQVFVEEID